MAVDSARENHVRHVGNDRRPAGPAGKLDHDGHRAGDDHRGRGAWLALGHARRYRDPRDLHDRVPDARRLRLHDQHDGHVRHGHRRRHPGGWRHRGHRICRPEDGRGHAAQGSLCLVRQADVLAHRLVHADDAGGVRAVPFLELDARQVHGLPANHADLRSDRLTRRGADLPARAGQRAWRTLGRRHGRKPGRAGGQR